MGDYPIYASHGFINLYQASSHPPMHKTKQSKFVQLSPIANSLRSRQQLVNIICMISTVQHRNRPFVPQCWAKNDTKVKRLNMIHIPCTFMRLTINLLNATIVSAAATSPDNVYQTLNTLCIKDVPRKRMSSLNVSPLIVELCPLVLDISTPGKWF